MSTPVVAFAFGSFGDIITIVQVLAKTFSILSDTHDAYAECRDFIAFLKDFELTLTRIAASFAPLLAPSSPLLQVQSNADILHNVLRLIKDCKDDIDAFNCSIQRSSNTSPPRGRAAVALAALTWSFSWSWAYREEAQTLRKKLKLRLSIITVEQQHIQFEWNRSLIMRVIGREPPSNGIRLLDLLNHSTFVPIQYCGTLQTFKEFLVKEYFRDRAGKLFVQLDAYDLTARYDDETDTESHEVDEDQWGIYVGRDACVEMDALRPAPLHSAGRYNSVDACLRCNTYNISRDGLGRSRCGYCDATFSQGTSKSGTRASADIPPFDNDWKLVQRFRYFFPSKPPPLSLIIPNKESWATWKPLEYPLPSPASTDSSPISMPEEQDPRLFGLLSQIGTNYRIRSRRSCESW